MLSPGNRAKPCKFRHVKASEELYTEDIAIERENSHFQRSHTHWHHLTSELRRISTFDISLISPKTTARGLHLCRWQYMHISVYFFYRAMLCRARYCHGKLFSVVRPSVCLLPKCMTFNDLWARFKVSDSLDAAKMPKYSLVWLRRHM